MRTSLTVATGLVLVAGVVVGVTTAQASSEQTPPIQPIRVEAPAADSAVAAETPALVPDLPADASAAREPAPQQAAPPQQAPQQAGPRDANGYVAPPPAADDDDDDDDRDDADDADDDGPGDD